MLCRPCRQIGSGRVTYGECTAHCHVPILPVTNVSLHILPKNHNTQETFQSTDYQGLKQIITHQCFNHTAAGTGEYPQVSVKRWVGSHSVVQTYAGLSRQKEESNSAVRPKQAQILHDSTRTRHLAYTNSQRQRRKQGWLWLVTSGIA